MLTEVGKQIWDYEEERVGIVTDSASAKSVGCKLPHTTIISLIPFRFVASSFSELKTLGK